MTLYYIHVYFEQCCCCGWSLYNFSALHCKAARIVMIIVHADNLMLKQSSDERFQPVCCPGGQFHLITPTTELAVLGMLNELFSGRKMC